MKLNRLETHDRLLHFKKDQEANIFKGAEDCLKVNPLSLAIQEKSPYVYLFAHPRTADDGVNKVMYWQPRLSVPEAQTNSYLFRAQSHSDIIDVIWLIPPKEMWSQYQKDKVTESDICYQSIEMYKHNRKQLEKPNPDDMPEERGKQILKMIIDEKRDALRLKKAKSIESFTQDFLAES